MGLNGGDGEGSKRRLFLDCSKVQRESSWTTRPVNIKDAVCRVLERITPKREIQEEHHMIYCKGRDMCNGLCRNMNMNIFLLLSWRLSQALTQWNLESIRPRWGQDADLMAHIWNPSAQEIRGSRVSHQPELHSRDSIGRSCLKEINWKKREGISNLQTHTTLLQTNNDTWRKAVYTVWTQQRP